MPDRHKTPPFRIRLPEDDRNWVLKQKEATDSAVNAIIVAAVREYRSHRETPDTETTQEQE